MSGSGYRERAAILTDAEEIAKGIRDWLSDLGKDIGGSMRRPPAAPRPTPVGDARQSGPRRAPYGAGSCEDTTGGGDAAKDPGCRVYSWATNQGARIQPRPYRTSGAWSARAIFVFTEGVGDAIVQTRARSRSWSD